MAGAAPEFTDFMAPEVNWIVRTEYASEFDRLIAEDEEQVRFERCCARELAGDIDD